MGSFEQQVSMAHQGEHFKEITLVVQLTPVPQECQILIRLRIEKREEFFFFIQSKAYISLKFIYRTFQLNIESNG